MGRFKHMPRARGKYGPDACQELAAIALVFGVRGPATAVRVAPAGGESGARRSYASTFVQQVQRASALPAGFVSGRLVVAPQPAKVEAVVCATGGSDTHAGMPGTSPGAP